MLRIGKIEYANCAPIFYALSNILPAKENYLFISGVPADLNTLLQSGMIDVCPSSSIEYAYHAESYCILPQLSISSHGNVASVLLFSKIPIEELDNHSILLSSESATSVGLLKIIMNQRYGCSCRYKIATHNNPESLDGASAILLIGDAALKSANGIKDMYVYDLGSLWADWTKLPFVFALWICRREISDSVGLKILLKLLLDAKRNSLSQLECIADNTPQLNWMGHEKLVSYWRENISYELGEAEIQGLKVFYKKAFEINLIDEIPHLHFVSYDQMKGDLP